MMKMKNKKFELNEKEINAYNKKTIYHMLFFSISCIVFGFILGNNHYKILNVDPILNIIIVAIIGVIINKSFSHILNNDIKLYGDE